MKIDIPHYSGLSVAKSVAAYTLLPGFWSRFVGFIPRFGMLAYLMAVIFESIKLLPAGHPFTQSSEMGRFRIRDVLAMAANNLHGGFKNSDHYVVFIMFLLGSILLGLQFVFLFFMIVTQTAQAAVPFLGMFITTYPETDIAHLMMDRVFGIPEFFNSCFDPVINASPVCEGYYTSPAFPTPFQQGLQALFRFYSVGILIVAGFVLVYYIIAMILETVNTGVPFGKRFQSIYTPMRLVIAVLLLLPLSYGYNTGQYIVLLSAKWGSGLATNAWLLFNNRIGVDNPMGMEPHQLVGKPEIHDIDSIINFIYLAQTCRAAYFLGVTEPDSSDGVQIHPYLVKAASSTSPAVAQQLANGTTFDSARIFASQGDVRIVFGEKNAAHTNYPAEVKPFCGEITMPTLSKEVNGITDIYNIYFKNILDIWYALDMEAYGQRMACNLKFTGSQHCATPAVAAPWDAPDKQAAGQQFYITTRQNFQANYTAQMDAQIDVMRHTANPELAMDDKVLLSGWGGAGLWFNKVMSFNGALVDAMSAVPVPTKLPMVMEHVAAKKRQAMPNVPEKDKFSLSMPSGGKAESMDKFMDDGQLGGSKEQNIKIAELLNETYGHVQDTQATSKPRTGNTDSQIKNFVNLLFGQTGLFDFRANSDVFPLAKLAMLGREMINKTVIMIATTTFMSGLGGVIGAELGPVGDVIQNFGPALRTFAAMGVSIGILLYYVVPLMPFIYFFFAVGRWIKSVFEAMVAIPLWALAHLRLGGEGMPGPAAGQGYFLILEIFLRPILTLFGMLVSIGSFMALTYGLDSVFNLAVTNVGGFDMTTISGGGVDNFANSMRDGVDALFYTVIYAILVYMIATSSFKLIDIIPNAVMRWGGTNTASFNDQTEPIDQINYNLVYKADAIARSMGGVGKNFDDAARLRNQGNPT